MTNEQRIAYLERQSAGRLRLIEELDGTKKSLEGDRSRLEAEVAALREACMPESPLHEGVFGCLLCGWDVVPSDPSTHEPSCLLAVRALAGSVERREGE